ncbi:MAG: sugar phosphate isomerase/epimerase [Clostridia bacterium]|nr:sugar phosphate isomerase/epimerase [Clostridia bacterium]
MKTSVSSYSFASMMMKYGDTHLTIIEKAKNIGFDAIEFTDLDVPEGQTELEYAKAIKAEAQRVGLEISGYSISADLLSGSGGDLDKEIERIKAKIDVAEALGTKLVRHDATFSFLNNKRGYNGFVNVLDRLAYGCREITQYAKSKGIRTAVENHGFFCQDSDRIELLVNTVADENFGIQLDMGNFLCVDENPATAVGRCAPYAFNLHAKDFIFKNGEEGYPGAGFMQTRGGNFIRGTVLGHGIVPIKQCISIMKSNGYDGYITLEFEGVEDLNFALQQGFVYMKTHCC